MEAVMRADPPPLRSLADTIPDELAAIVHKCLRKAPEARYATAGELALHLRSFGRYSSGGQGSGAADEDDRSSGGALVRWLRRPAVAIVVLLLLVGGPAWTRRPPSFDFASSVPAEKLRAAQAYLARDDRKGNIDRAIAVLEPAVAEDAANAALHAALTEAYLLKYSSLNDRAWLQKASESARRALAANADLAAAHLAQGKTLAENGQNDEASIELQRAIVLDPLSSAAHVAMAKVRFAQGRARRPASCTRRPSRLHLATGFRLAGLVFFTIAVPGTPTRSTCGREH